MTRLKWCSAISLINPMIKILISFIFLCLSTTAVQAERYVTHSKSQTTRITHAPRDKEKIFVTRGNRTEICEWADHLNRPIHCKSVRFR